jgi:hypothetical protein
MYIQRLNKHEMRGSITLEMIFIFSILTMLIPVFWVSFFAWHVSLALETIPFHLPSDRMFTKQEMDQHILDIDSVVDQVSQNWHLPVVYDTHQDLVAGTTTRGCKFKYFLSIDIWIGVKIVDEHWAFPQLCPDG